MTKKKKKFDKSKLKKYDDVVIKKVDISKEWPDMGDVYVRSMTGKSRDSYEAAAYFAGEKAKETGVGSELDNQRANMVIATACHEDGTLIFTQADAEWLGDQSSKALDKIVDMGQELAGMSAKDIDEMEKSLKAAQS